MRVPSYGLVAAVYGLALGASGACTSPHKLISARRTTCPMSKLEIRELVSQGDHEDWIAVCGERSFACSTREQGNNRLVYACHALKTSAASRTAQDAGALEDATSATPLSAPPAAAASDAAVSTDTL